MGSSTRHATSNEVPEKETDPPLTPGRRTMQQQRKRPGREWTMDSSASHVPGVLVLGWWDWENEEKRGERDKRQDKEKIGRAGVVTECAMVQYRWRLVNGKRSSFVLLYQIRLFFCVCRGLVCFWGQRLRYSSVHSNKVRGPCAVLLVGHNTVPCRVRDHGSMVLSPPLPFNASIINICRNT